MRVKNEGLVADARTRLLAWLVDACVAAMITLPLNPALYSDAPDVPLVGVLLGSAMLVWFVVMVRFEGGSRGASPGKRISGIRVVDAENLRSIGYRRAALRRLAYVLGGLPLYGGWIIALRDPARRALHDRVARSLVVCDRLERTTHQADQAARGPASA